MYNRTLARIKTATENSVFERDTFPLRVTIDILNQMAESHGSETNDLIYMPVEKAFRLSFEPISKCVYCDDNERLDHNEHDVYQVHSELSNKTAKSLGVKSFKQHTLSETYTFEEWGQEEPLTTKIRNLIKHGYTDGFAVIKEMFQNAEDAKASKFFLLFDYRDNSDFRSRLLCHKLGAFQGPALWVYNDVSFSEKDFENIKRLGEGTKENDPGSIGKFGLGFCSVYNITDLPSLLSDSSMVIFDPHSTNLSMDSRSLSPGLRVDFMNGRNKHVRERFMDQFKPFQDVFGCDICSQNQPHFNGTLFRLPFRTQSSELSDTVYSVDRIEMLFNTIAGKMDNLLLFNENVTDIRVYNLLNGCSNPKDSQLKLEVKKQCRRLNANYDNNVSIATEVACRNQRKGPESAEVLTLIEEISIKTIIGDTHDKRDLWLVATASSKEVECCINELPIAAIAIPVSTDEEQKEPVYNALQLKSQGRYFCTLPLGQQFHHFAFHINGHFKVSFDRLHLLKCKSDERFDNTDSSWNTVLMRDNVVTALVSLLSETNIDNLYDIWPDSCEDEFENCFTTSFYDRIARSPCRVFKNRNTRLDLSKSLFLCPKALHDMDDHQISVTTITAIVNDSSLIVDVPSLIFEHLKKSAGTYMDSRIISAELFLLKFVFSNWDLLASGMTENDRNNLLKFAITVRNVNIKSNLQTSACIPTDDERLELPSNLIDEESEIGKLFPSGMGFFPRTDFIDESIKQSLVDIGLRSELLSDDMVIDRARAVLLTYSNCAECAKLLCQRLLKYLSEHIVSEHTAILKTLSTIQFLPVMGRPQGWPFKWHASSSIDTLPKVKLCKEHLETKTVPILWKQPNNLYAPACHTVLGCSKYMVETDLFDSNERTLRLTVSDFHEIFEAVGIEKIPEKLKVSSLVDNLLIASDTVNAADTANDKIASRFQDMYDCIERKGGLSEVQTLKKVTVVWTSDRLVSIEDLSRDDFEYRSLCYPFIFSIVDSQMRRCPLLCEALKIRHHFAAKDIATVIQKIKNKYNDSAMSDNTTSSVVALLKILKLCFGKEDITNLEEFLSENDLIAIYAPDENMKMRSCTEMCLDDSAIEKSETMTYIHRDVPHNIAIEFGAVRKYIHQLNECSEDVEDFYQEEPLVTRLRRLLDGYPCDSGLFKELLQNADDAGATEVVFMLDFDTHSGEHIFNKESEPLQGPALCVYNDSPFSSKDLKGIKDLGNSGKFGNVATIGNYGVGFNSVYHLTDTPSFLTKGSSVENGETLCIFDPLAKHLPDIKATKPGKRYKNVSLIRNNYADLLLGYHEQRFFKRNKGTVFRFPLRKDVSDIKPNSFIEIGKLEKLLKCFTQELSHTVVFLRSIENVRILYHHHGAYFEQNHLHINVTGSNTEERKSLHKAHAQLCTDFQNDKDSIFDFEQKSFNYELETEMHVYKGTKTVQSFQVIQTLGFKDKEDVSPFVRDKYKNENRGLLPQGGVVHSTASGIGKGKAYCFLPLPINTGLPVHVNGHFALTHETRRAIWKAENVDECYKTQWNVALIQHVISKAHILLLQSMIQQCSNHYPENVRELKDIYSCFPIHKCANGFFWKELTVTIYKRLFHEDLRFLPCLYVNMSMKEILNVHIIWNKPISDCQHCPVYKYKLHTKPNSTELELKQTLLSTCLKYIGIPLFEIPGQVLESIQSSKCKLTKLSPKYVIEFLCSHRNPSCACCEMNVNEVVERTKFKTCDNVKTVIEYCALNTESLFENLMNVPLFLTEDKVLRTLSSNQTVFVTEFTDLFPPSQWHNFLHKCLLQSVCSIRDETSNYEVLSKGLLKHLTLSDFHSFARKGQTNIAISEESCVPLQERDKVFIPRVWTFFTDEICYELKQKDIKSTDKGELQDITSERLMEIASLCLIPAVCNEANDQILISFNDIDMLIELDSFAAGSALYEAISNFNIYRLNKQLLHNASSDMLYASDIVLQHIPRSDKPRKILQCFVKNLEKIKRSKPNPVLAKAVLKYFNDNVRSLKDEDVQMIKLFPFFESYSGELVVIDGPTTVYVFLNGIPAAGLHRFNHDENILFLKDEHLVDLYQQIGIRTPSVAETYVNLIFPRQTKMTTTDFHGHIEFVCIHLFSGKESQSDRSLSKALERLAFINVGDNIRQKRINELFYEDAKQKPFFSIMCKRDKMLPKRYHLNPMLDVFKIMGLQWEMTTELFERFARDIESDSLQRGHINECKEKSQVLLASLFSWTNLRGINLNTMREIKFIFPKQVKSKLLDIHAQRSITHPVSLSDSVYPSEKNIHSCWTISPILPDNVHLPEGFKLELGIHQKPPIDDVFNHCLNIGRSLEGKLPQKLALSHGEEIKSIMTHIYETLASYNLTWNPKPSVLRRVPLIYFPDCCLMRHASNVVMACNEDDEIAPYLVKIPSYYGRFEDLFIKLGASKTVTVDNYVDILAQMFQEFGAQKLEESVKSNALKAMSNLFRQMKRHSSTEHHINSPVYLLDETTCLRRGNELVVCDNTYLRERVENGVRLDFMIAGCNDVKLNVILDGIKAFPSGHKPQILSEIVREEVYLSDLKTDIQQTEATSLQKYIHDDNYIGGFCRLARHAMGKNNLTWTDAEENKIKSYIKNMTCKQATGIKTHLVRNVPDRSEPIENTFEPKDVHIDTDNSTTVVLFEADFTDDLRNKVHESITCHLNALINNCLQNDLLFLALKLLSCNSQWEFTSILDRKNIEAYGDIGSQRCIVLRTTCHPEPGRYVPNHMQGLLFQDWIEPDEYMALETDHLQCTYKFVKVLHRVDTTDKHRLLQRYEVDVGEETPIVVLSFKMFSFNQARMEQSENYVVEPFTENDNKSGLSFESICMEIKETLAAAWTLDRSDERKQIVVGLIRKWHPDKNHKQIELSTKVFQYIQQCLQTLERDGKFSKEEPSAESEDTGYTQTPHEDYTRWFGQQWHSYSGKARFERHDTEEEPIHDFSEAARWQRQAISDLESARTSFDVYSRISSNWVCYQAHQAAEKSLKAAWYAKDANQVNRIKCTHSLTELSQGLDDNLVRLTQQLCDLTGDHTRMRYPDTMSAPQIPAEYYSHGNAETCLQIATEVIEIVEKDILTQNEPV